MLRCHCILMLAAVQVLMTQERLLGSWHPSTCITRANLTHQCEQNDRELPFMSRNPEWGKYDSALNASLPRTQPWISQVVRKEAKPAVSPIKARPWDVPMPQAHGLHSAPTVSSDTTMQYSRRDFSLDLPLPVEDALVSPSTKRSPQRLKPFHSVPLETHIGSRSRRQENLTSMVWKTRWKLP